jgi:hypothetical protein
MEYAGSPDGDLSVHVKHAQGQGGFLFPKFDTWEKGGNVIGSPDGSMPSGTPVTNPVLEPAGLEPMAPYLSLSGRWLRPKTTITLMLTIVKTNREQTTCTNSTRAWPVGNHNTCRYNCAVLDSKDGQKPNGQPKGRPRPKQENLSFEKSG